MISGVPRTPLTSHDPQSAAALLGRCESIPVRSTGDCEHDAAVRTGPLATAVSNEGLTAG